MAEKSYTQRAAVAARAAVSNRLTAVFLPAVSIYEGNPYWSLLQMHLEREGVCFVGTEDPMYLQWRWLVRHRRQVDVLHLHHFQHHYAASDSPLHGYARRVSLNALVRFLLKLSLARLLGYRIVWTVHELYPHERLNPKWLERLTHLAVAHLASALIVHCQEARRSVSKEFYRRRNVYVTPMGSYVGVYPESISKQEARASLSLDEGARVYLFLGSLRPYKGLERLVKAFRSLPHKDIALVIAGRPWAAFSMDRLRALAEGDDRIHLLPGFVPEEDLQRYFRAADLVVLPFEGVNTSASAHLAISFGRPVIAPALGCLPENIPAGAGILYDASDPDGLVNALRCSLAIDAKALGQRASEQARRLSWIVMARQTLQIYKNC